MQQLPSMLIRHPSTVPLHYRRFGETVSRSTQSEDPGLCFATSEQLAPGSLVELTIPAAGRTQSFRLQVLSCQPVVTGFEVRGCFVDENDAFVGRMIEQVCYIEAYRCDVEHREGRRLSREHAAREWIERFAAAFPATEFAKGDAGSFAAGEMLAE